MDGAVSNFLSDQLICGEAIECILQLVELLICACLFGLSIRMLYPLENELNSD